MSIFVNQGIVATELPKIKLDDLDLIKATIKIKGGKRLKDRILPLKASQIGLIMQYLQKIRPQLLEYNVSDSKKMFLPIREVSKKHENSEIDNFLPLLARQIRQIDKQFLNFTQIRASLITNWLKTHGLRKAQYMAGHRFISTTEAYLSNNLDDLTDDINKLHPF